LAIACAVKPPTAPPPLTAVISGSAGRADAITRRFGEAQDRLVLQAADLSLEAVAAMVDQNAIDIAPEFQRRERWGIHRQSALIESFLLNIPVPPVYLSEEDFGRYSVIDGKQRITAVHAFMRDKFGLTTLEQLTDLEGAHFSGLPSALSNALKVRPYIRAVTLLRQSDPEIKYEVFHRLNAGGEPLNAQEIRNVVFRGPLNDAIMRLAEHPFLRRQLKIKDVKSNAYRTMQDAEYVVRFLTLRETWKGFGADFRLAMNTYMRRHLRATEAEVSQTATLFTRTIEACEALWGDHAFQRYDRGQWRDQTMGAMYDAQMIAVSGLTAEEVSALMLQKRDLEQETQRLFADPQFEISIRVSTNTPSRLVYRISTMQGVLRTLLHGT
jgi:Protein of unknown function DUF262